MPQPWTQPPPTHHTPFVLLSRPLGDGTATLGGGCYLVRIESLPCGPHEDHLDSQALSVKMVTGWIDSYQSSNAFSLGVG